MKRKVTQNPYPGVVRMVEVTFKTDEEEAEFYKPYTDAVREATKKAESERRAAINAKRQKRGQRPLIY